jgi:hypothetical protein
MAQIASVSCPSTGNCGTGGSYIDRSGKQQGFVVNESSGIWGTAKEVPGLAGLNKFSAFTGSVSCGGAGNCSAGGSYGARAGSNDSQAFVVSQKKGLWGMAEEAPGTAILNKGADAWVAAVSCASAGNCSAGGSYTDKSGRQQVFVMGQTNGIWGTAEQVPGSAALNVGQPGAEIASVSCAAAGRCTAGGSYTDSSGIQQAFVVTEN